MLFELLLVIAITDGDTIKVLDNDHMQHKVRLASIDAPERGQPFGAKSKQMLSELIGTKKVNLKRPTKDRYQRLICTVSLNGMDVNREMVRRGGAWVYRSYYKGADYYEAENEARDAQAGLWSTSEYRAVAPWEWRKKQRQKRKDG